MKLCVDLCSAFRILPVSEGDASQFKKKKQKGAERLVRTNDNSCRSLQVCGLHVAAGSIVDMINISAVLSKH